MDSCRIRSAPALQAAVDKADREIQARPSLPNYQYPAEVITSSRAGRWSKYGIEIRIDADELQRINNLDAQKETGKEIFGSGFLSSERVAAITTDADARCIKQEREIVYQLWELSERERAIIARLDTEGAKNGR